MRFVIVDGAGLAGLDRSESAGPRANIAQQHKRGGAAAPAFATIGAARCFADGMQTVLLHRCPGFAVMRLTAEILPYPDRHTYSIRQVRVFLNRNNGSHVQRK